VKDDTERLRCIGEGRVAWKVSGEFRDPVSYISKADRLNLGLG
jgi:hypothetical protein